MAERHLDHDRLGDHIDRLYRAAWGMCGSREDAEDLVQETFARVLRRPRLLRSDDDLGYLLRVLQNTFRSRLRTQSRRVREVELADDAPDLADPRAVDPQRQVEMTELYAAIAELPPDFRDAVIAVDLVGLTYAEAGRLLGAREATITTRLHRGRRRLADRLS